MDAIIVICAFLLMTATMLVVSIRKFNELTEDIAKINSDVCELQAWISIAEHEQKQKEQEEKEAEKEQALNKALEIIRPIMQKYLQEGEREVSVYCNRMLAKLETLKPVLTEEMYDKIKLLITCESIMENARRLKEQKSENKDSD